MAIKFLSDEWAAALTKALNDSEEFREAAAGQIALMQMTVTGAPDGDVSYFMSFDEGEVEIALGRAPDTPDLEASINYDNAVAMSKGELGGQQAAMTGKMQTSGNMTKIMGLSKALGLLPSVEQGLGVEY